MDTIDTEVTDTNSKEFDEEKFQDELSGLLGRINDEENYNTVTESLIPELERLVMPAIEAGTNVRTLKYAILRRLRGDSKYQALTVISKIAITTYLKNAQKEGIIKEPLLYGNFEARLLEAERCRWKANDRYEDSNIDKILQFELERAIRSGDMDTGMITQIAQIVFPDYASIIPGIVARTYYEEFSRTRP